MQIWSISKLKLPLKFDWKISRNTSLHKVNFIVRLEQDGTVGKGEVAFNIRYGETEFKILEDFRFFCNIFGENKDFTEKDLTWLLESKELCSSLKMGINQAFYHVNQETHNEMINLEIPDSLITSFSIPIIDTNDVDTFLADNNLYDYPFLKLKISGSDSLPLMNKLSEVFQGKIRIDANEGFKSAEEVSKFIDNFKDLSKIEFIEQPLPSSMNKEMIYLKGKFDVDFIADESITEQENISELAEFFDGINIKLMKSGTIENAIGQLNEARQYNLKTMLGCMIETSLSISLAYKIGGDVDFIDLDGFLLIKEDPYKLLFENKGLITMA
jgi:L-Ala-D/L-Glu epimerase